MQYFLVQLLIVMLHLNLSVKATTSSGCRVITSDGRCFSHNSTRVSWYDARTNCQTLGGDLPTLTSLEDTELILTVGTGMCWIGYNEIENDAVFVWADGSESTFTNWASNRPSSMTSSDVFCVIISGGSGKWSEIPCSSEQRSYCSRKVYPFGRQLNATSVGLLNNSILFANTILYCLTENLDTPIVTWNYEDLTGTQTILTSTTDASTGISTLSVISDNPGFYSCQVTQDGGMNKIYTVEMLDMLHYTVVANDANYTYTLDIDENDVFLLCLNSEDTSTKPSTYHWREKNSIQLYSNPLNISKLGTDSYSMECLDIATDVIILGVGLIIQGPPMITLNNGSISSFSLLPPAINRAEVSLLTQDIVISSNLIGRWQTPDNSILNDSSIILSRFYSTDAGRYKFYVTGLDGQERLAIELFIPLYITEDQIITNLRTEYSNMNSILVLWDLAEDISIYENDSFSLYLKFANIENFVGSTKDLHYNITALFLSGIYTIRVELKLNSSIQSISATIGHVVFTLPPSHISI